MGQTWKWSFGEAFSIILKTYIDDWGQAHKERQEFLSQPHVKEINDPSVTGLQAGEGQAVIFIHGSPGNAMRWSQYLQNVPAGYQFISIDRRGFAARSHQKPDLEQDFESLRIFLQKFKNPILVGHSLGGALATRLAAASGVKGLILVAASIDPALERVLPVQKLGAHPLVSWLLSKSIHHSNLEMFPLQKFMQGTEIDLSKIKIPVHIVHAQDDALVPVAHVDYARQKFTKASYVDVTSPELGGHSIPWSAPELVLSAIEAVTIEKKAAA